MPEFLINILQDLLGKYIWFTVGGIIILLIVLFIISYRASVFIISFIIGLPIIHIGLAVLNSIFNFIDDYDDIINFTGLKISLCLSFCFALVNAIIKKPPTAAEQKAIDEWYWNYMEEKSRRRKQMEQLEAERQNRYEHVCANCRYCFEYRLEATCSYDNTSIISPNRSTCYHFELSDHLT